MRDPLALEMDQVVGEGLAANLTLNCSSSCVEKVLPEPNGTEAIPEHLFKPNFPVTVVYCILFVVAAVGNLTVFISLFRSRHRKSRISLMIRHLAIADLIVTFVMIPLEVSWRLTSRWLAGNVACKVLLFLRALGPYLSSNVLICVSLDRYFAVLHPLKVNDARRRGKIMLAVAWGASFVYCIPQSFIFRVMRHPKYPNYTQCVSFDFFTPAQEVAYNLMCVMFLYFIPLFVIIVAYTAIMCEISKNSKGTQGESYRASNGRMRLRRSDISNIERARRRTLRMTITIVVVYIWCCTPYVFITLWYMFDREGATRLPEWLQDTFFMMVASNSCMNPVVYGSYVVSCRHSCCCFNCFKKGSNDTHLTDGEMQLAAGQRKEIARRVIKCVLGLKKGGLSRKDRQVGSGNTRSTAIGNAITRSPIEKSPPQMTGAVVKRSDNPKKRPPSVGHTTFSSEHSSSCSGRVSFHSEPLTTPYTSLEQQTLGILASSEPNMSPKGNIKININDSEVYYNRGHSERNRTRNI